MEQSTKLQGNKHSKQLLFTILSWLPIGPLWKRYWKIK
jgi:hypothetical protein